MKKPEMDLDALQPAQDYPKSAAKGTRASFLGSGSSPGYSQVSASSPRIGKAGPTVAGTRSTFLTDTGCKDVGGIAASNGNK